MKDLYPLSYFGLYKNALLMKGRDNNFFETKGGALVKEILEEVRASYSHDEMHLICDLLLNTERERTIVANADEYHQLSRVHAQRSVNKWKRIKHQLAQIADAEIRMLKDLRNAQKLVQEITLLFDEEHEAARRVWEKYSQEIASAESGTDAYSMLITFRRMYVEYLQTFDLSPDFPGSADATIRVYEQILDTLAIVVGPFVAAAPVSLPFIATDAAKASEEVEETAPAAT